MRKSQQETAETRRRIVTTAATEFRRNGIEATGVADLMAAAGLTHGGFYRHFDSKDQLVAEACAEALAATTASLDSAAQKKPRQGLPALLKKYLSTSHRDNPQQGCAFAALGTELTRTDKETRDMLTERFARLVDLLAQQFEGMKPAEARKRGMAAASTMIGSLMMSRVVTDPQLSQAILKSAEQRILDS